MELYVSLPLEFIWTSERIIKTLSVVHDCPLCSTLLTGLEHNGSWFIWHCT